MPQYDTFTNAESQPPTKDKDMDRIRALFRRKQREDEYAPLAEGENDLEDSTFLVQEEPETIPFSWLEYAIFALLGVAMLWAW